jgi:hypothetical protein
MTGTGMRLSLADIQFIRKVKKCKEDIEKSGKSVSPEQKIEWIAGFLGCTKAKVIESLQNKNALYTVSGDDSEEDLEGEETPTPFESFIDNDSPYHRLMPGPATAFEAKERQTINKEILLAWDFVFSQKIKDIQKPLLKQVLTNEYADAIPLEAKYSFLDYDLLSKLKAGGKFTRREIAAAYYPEKSVSKAETTAKMVLIRFIKQVDKHLKKNPDLYEKIKEELLSF